MAGATGAPVSYFTQPFLNNLANTAGSSGTTQSTGASQNGGPLVPMPQVTYTPASSQPASNAYTATTQQPTSGWNINTAASQGLQSAMANTAQGQYYQPQQVQATGYRPAMVGATGYNPTTLAGTNLSSYTNPYESSVISGLQSDALRGQQMASNQLGAQATAAGAFGGSRHGIAEGQMAGDIQNQLNNQIAGLRQSGFQNAQQMALADAAAQNQAGQFGASAMNQAALQNQAAANQAGMFGAQNAMTAQQLNQSAGLAGAQQRLSAANQMGNLSNLGFGMGQQINNQMMVQGAMQQALQQQAMDKAAQQYAGYQQSPYQALSAMTSAVSGTPYPQSSTQTSTQNTQRGLFDYLALLA